MSAAQPRTAIDLRAAFKAGMEDHPESSRIRIHRAISWIERSESEQDDPDARFIFLWIAFNAAYAQEFGFERTEREQLREFFRKICDSDQYAKLRSALFQQFTGAIRTLIGNRHVYEPFWRALREHDSSDKWSRDFEASQRSALKAVVAGDCPTVLGVVFDRLYILRNQLVHGGATWNGRVNREQVKDGASILAAIVPLIIEIMIETPTNFGGILYPVV